MIIIVTFYAKLCDNHFEKTRCSIYKGSLLRDLFRVNRPIRHFEIYLDDGTVNVIYCVKHPFTIGDVQYKTDKLYV